MTRAEQSHSPARQRTLVESLQLRFLIAEQQGNAAAKRALFQEAIYLGIQPELFTEPK
tara:strand:+ start:56 stop:229 length:174 start_codon:yes stop_codon:yes gene_type:complete